MRTIVMLALVLFYAGVVQAQVGTSISADGSAPNNNAMLDVQSPTSGAGKGILIPRVTQAQRTTADGNQPGGLLDSSGNLRGGAAQGLIVYQTDMAEGLYFNTSQSAVPTWIYLGTSTTNYLPLTGGTMSGALNMGGQIISNTASIDFSGNDVAVGRGANGLSDGVGVGFQAIGVVTGVAVGASANGSGNGAAVGGLAKGTNYGVAVGRSANGINYGVAVGYAAKGSTVGAALGYLANGSDYGAALGRQANGAVDGAAVGEAANGTNYGAAVGSSANGANYGAAVGYSANGPNDGAAMGDSADGATFGAAMGYYANGAVTGAAVGYLANGFNNSVAVGRLANGYDHGTAMGNQANGTNYGAAVGQSASASEYGTAIGLGANANFYGSAVGDGANGYFYGAAVGASANGAYIGAAVGVDAKASSNGVALGYLANGTRTNVAIGMRANARGGTNHIAIGYNVTNNLGNDTAVIRGKLYLDGPSGGVYTNVGGFGSSDWGLKAFTIDHPLDPENKILRHFCLEGPQVWNVYAGNAQLVNGQAVIELPDYYEALNLVGSEIYSLTPISSDRRATVVIEQEVTNNCFVIGGSSDIKVSWTIKVLRNDPGCREDLRRRPVEQLKRELQ